MDCCISRSTLLLLLVGSALLSSATSMGNKGRRRSSDSSSEKRNGKKPNLLFIMTDQQRFDAMSFAGQNKILRTKNLDRLAASGVWFKNAYTSAPVCEPARTSLLTGLSIENTGVQQNNMPGRPDLKSYDYHLVKNEGYVAEYYGKWHAPHNLAGIYQNEVDLDTFNLFGPFRAFLKSLGYQSPPQVPTGMVIESMSGQPYTPNPIDSRFKSRTKSAKGVCECDQYGVSQIRRGHTLTSFESWRTIVAMRRLARGKKPFSLHVSFNSPHGPHAPSRPFTKYYNASRMPIPASIHDDLADSPYKRNHENRYGNPELVGHMIASYYAQVKEVDVWLGRIFSEMDKLGLSNNTMIVFTSDHGEMLGSHGMIEKNVLLEESARVPLIISFPGAIPHKRRVGTPVSHRDIFATVLDYLGAKRRPSDGISLRSLIEDRQPRPHIEYTVSENGRDKELMIRAGRYKLILPNQANSTRLNAFYNLHDDPHEMTNLLARRNTPKARTRHVLRKANHLKRILVHWCRRVKSPHVEQIRARLI